MLGLACVDIALLRYTYLGGTSSVQIGATRPIMNIHGDRLNKVFGNCLKEKNQNIKLGSAINSTPPGILDEIARPGLFPDYEYDSSVFTPQSGIVPDTVVSNPRAIVDLDVKLYPTFDARVASLYAIRDYYQRTGEDCCRQFRFKFSPQSGFVSTYKSYDAQNVHKETNTRFRDKETDHILEVGAGSDDLHVARDTNDVSLNAFFSRPLKVYQFDWDVGTGPTHVFSPWQLYFGNAKVVEKLNNFQNIRCRLNVKFVVNGNSFLYGRMMASYLPFDNLNSYAGCGGVAENTVIESQRPRVFLDPCLSQGGTLKLPWFWHKTYAKIPSGEIATMGNICIRTINDLRHASGGDGSVTVSVFVWAEDVQLTGLTMVPQSGTEVDQANMSGVISQPASAIAELAGALGSAPLIGKYARATQLGASSIAKAASAFGYCKPPLTKCPEPMRPTPHSTLAVTNTPDASFKLTIDEKQELCIDPNTVGLSNVDEMEIKEIAKKESYFATILWNMGTVTETLLYNMEVTPVQYQSSTNDYFLTACGYAALPFKYWTGTLNFRFQIVASAFHRGRLRIVYDPNVGSATAPYNTAYSEIVDIADTMDVTISIGNNQETDLLEHHALCGESEPHGIAPITTDGIGNGVLSVYVLNELTAPEMAVEDNGIMINVFISAGDDFEVFVPDDTIKTLAFVPQAGYEVQSGNETTPESQNTNEPSAPFLTEADHLGMQATVHDALTSVYAGESIKSFRQLAKRFCYWRGALVSTNGTLNPKRFRITHPAFPHLCNDSAIPDVNTTFIHWVTMPYAGWRGSIRYKMMPDNQMQPADMFVELLDSPLNIYTESDVTQPSQTVRSTSAQTWTANVGSFVVTGLKGAAHMNSTIGSSMEYEVPYQTRYRFDPSKLNPLSNGSAYSRGAAYLQTGDANFFRTTHIWVGAGEDFSTFFWVGPPRIRCIAGGS